MSLQTSIQSAVGGAFKAISGLSTSTVIIRNYVSNEDTEFNASSGGGNQTYTDYTLTYFALVGFTQKEVAAGIAGAEDKKLLFPQNEIAITPTNEDSVLIDTVQYNIFDEIKADPANATWTIKLRKT